MTTPTVSMYRIAETVLGASAASIDFTSIPSTFKHLRLVGHLRADTSNTFDSSRIAFNNDTTDANYDKQQAQALGTTQTDSQVQAGAGSRIIGTTTAATSPANHFASVVIDIPDYAGANFKIAQVTMAWWGTRSASGLAIIHNAIGWADTTAINRVTFTPTGSNYVSGSVMSLYGIKAGA